MPLEVVCASDKGPLGLSWDAWVAIGTIFLAVVTAIAVILPIIMSYLRRVHRTARYAMMFDHELAMLYGSMLRRALESAPDKRTSANIRGAMQELFASNKLLRLPLLQKLVDRIEEFPPNAAAKLGLALSAVLAARANKVEELPMRAEEAAMILEVAFDESIALAFHARQAIEATRPLAPRHVKFPKLGAVPKWALERQEVLKARHGGRDLPI